MGTEIAVLKKENEILKAQIKELKESIQSNKVKFQEITQKDGEL